MKSSYQKRMLKAAILIWLIPLAIWLISCGSTNHYKLTCADYATLAAHVVDGESYVAIDHNHAQAFVLDNGDRCWLAINSGYLVIDVPREVEEIKAIYNLEDWDYLIKHIWKHQVGMAKN